MDLIRLLWLVPAAVCCLTLSSCVSDGKDDKVEEYVKVGDLVPSFSVKTRDGDAVDFTKADFEGKSSIIVLFTAECPNCTALMPHVDEAWQAIEGNDEYRIIAIARESSKGAVDGLGMSMPYYLDPDRSAFNKFANLNVPRLYCIDNQGVIRWVQIGEQGITKNKLLGWLGYTGS